jgi:hypothetical protein
MKSDDVQRRSGFKGFPGRRFLFGGSLSEAAPLAASENHWHKRVTLRAERGGNGMKSATIIVLALLVAFLADRVVRIENQRYALQVGVCKLDPGNPAPGWRCLDDVQTRTSWLWHLYYAATERVPPVPFWGR